MNNLKKGRFTMEKDGAYYVISEQGFEYLAIHQADLEAVLTLLLLAQADMELHPVERDAQKMGVMVQ